MAIGASSENHHAVGRGLQASSALTGVIGAELVAAREHDGVIDISDCSDFVLVPMSACQVSVFTKVPFMCACVGESWTELSIHAR